MARHPSDPVRWLSPAEKEGWTGLASLVLLLPGRLEAPLQREHGLSLFDYLTLSHLSEVDDGRLRMSELAYLAHGSLSRLSNVVKRFEARGWVERTPDPDDGRYTLVALTDEGREVVESAAPTHVDAVRREALDQLTADEQATLARIAERLRVRPEDHS
ncbi:MAG: MarR family transcriptional regulator [Propionibacteriales bacterium]|nr:MarR family transcriptional regulator [Propionibacteriales bacterium]